MSGPDPATPADDNKRHAEHLEEALFEVKRVIVGQDRMVERAAWMCGREMSDWRAGAAAYVWLVAATRLAVSHKIDAIVTAPLHKKRLSWPASAIPAIPRFSPRSAASMNTR